MASGCMVEGRKFMSASLRAGKTIDSDRSVFGQPQYRRRRATALAIASAATVVALVDAPSATGSAITFTAAAANAAWTTAGNWSPSVVPGVNDDVIIPAG